MTPASSYRSVDFSYGWRSLAHSRWFPLALLALGATSNAIYAHAPLVAFAAISGGDAEPSPSDRHCGTYLARKSIHWLWSTGISPQRHRVYLGCLNGTRHAGGGGFCQYSTGIQPIVLGRPWFVGGDRLHGWLRDLSRTDYAGVSDDGRWPLYGFGHYRQTLCETGDVGWGDRFGAWGAALVAPFPATSYPKLINVLAYADMVLLTKANVMKEKKCDRPRHSNEPRKTRLVFTGHNLYTEMITQAVKAQELELTVL